MATPEAIDEFVRRSIQFVRQNAAEIERRLNNQRSRESEIIQRTNTFCPLAQIQDRTVRAEDVERALREGYEDGNILQALMCLNNSIVLFPPSAGTGRSFKVRQYLANLKQIGAESAEGYAMTADVKSNISTFQSSRGLFVVKAPRYIDESLRANQIHEYFVGAFGTNTLRSRIPNFAFVLGFFQCAPPYIDARGYLTNSPVENPKDRPALTYCQNDVSENQVNYLIYENVTNSVTLKDFIINGCSYSQFLNILTQCVLALQLAYLLFGFTHGDLHTENVLIKELPEEIYIPYQVDEVGTVRYLRTKYVATIIDLGRSHIQFEGNHYGYALIEYGLYPDRAYPMYDIYKLLMFSLAAAAFGNNSMVSYAGISDDQLLAQGKLVNPEVFQNAKELVSYFHPGIVRNNVTKKLITAGDYLVKTRRFFYSLPYSPEFDIPPSRFFRDAILVASPQVVGEFMSSIPGNPDRVYGCANKGTCLSLEQAINEYSNNDITYVGDPYTFYEIYIEVITGRNNQIRLEQLLSLGQAQLNEYKDILQTDVNTYLTQYEELRLNYTIVSLVGGAPENVKFRNPFLEEYRRFVAKSVKMVDVLTSLRHIQIILNTMGELFPGQISTLPELNLLQGVYQNMNEVISSLQLDATYIGLLNQRDIFRINPNAGWLFQKLPTLKAAIDKFNSTF